MLPEVEAQSLNHWTTRKSLECMSLPGLGGAGIILRLPRLQVATFSGPPFLGSQRPGPCPSLQLLLLSQSIQLGRWPSPSIAQSTRLALCRLFYCLVHRVIVTIFLNSIYMC